MSQAAVNVSGIAPATSEKELHDFFSFCGTIKSIDLNGNEGQSKTAVVTFDKPSAAHTAVMLNGGNLGGRTLTVASDVEHQAVHHDVHDRPHLEQSDKPRAGIAAEYLAKGYTLSDHILQRAIDIDGKHGISKKFLSFMSDLDVQVGQRALGPDQTVSGRVQSGLTEAQSRAKSIDQQKGYSKSAQDYYTKALASPLGQSVLAFYTSTSKQVRDIHEEALRIQQHKTNTQTSPPGPTPGPAPGGPAPGPAPTESAPAPIESTPAQSEPPK